MGVRVALAVLIRPRCGDSAGSNAPSTSAGDIRVRAFMMVIAAVGAAHTITNPLATPDAATPFATCMVTSTNCVRRSVSHATSA